MSTVAQAINSFGLPEGQAQPDDQLILTRGQLQEIIQAAIQPLVARIDALECLVAQKSPCSAQEGQENPLEVIEHHAQIIQALNVKLEAFSEKLGDVETRIDSVDESTQLERAYDRQRIAKLEGGVTTPTPLPPARGSKTETRIAKLKEILKARGSSQTFGQLQRDLSLSPSQFTKLVAKLDKRSFQIGKRPRSRFNEKVLGLRAKLYDPI